MKPTNTHVRNGLAIVLALVLSVVLTITGLLVSLKSTLFFENFVFTQIEDVDYAFYVQEYFLEVVASKAVLYGVDAEYLNEPFTQEKMKEDIFRSTRLMFDGETPDFFLDELSDDVKAHLIAYANDNNITLTIEVEAGIDELTASLVKDYTRIMQVPLFKNFVSVKVVFDRIFWIALSGLVVFGGLIGWMLMKLYKNKHRGLRMMSHATSAAGLMSLIILVPMYFSRFYERIQIRPRFFNLLLSEIIESALGVSILIAVGWFVISGLLIYSSEHQRSIKNKQ